MCSVNIVIGTVVAVWRSDWCFEGKLAVIGDLRSSASLWVFGRGVGSIGAVFEVSSFFRSFFPAFPLLTVFPLSILQPSSFLVFYSLLLSPVPMNSCILMTILHNLPRIFPSISQYGFWSVSSLVQGSCPFRHLFCHTSIRSVYVLGVSSLCKLSDCHPTSGLVLSSWCSSKYKVGAFHPGVWSLMISWCSRRYNVGALFISDIDVPGQLHPVIEWVIISTVSWKVDISICVCSARRVGCFHQFLLSMLTFITLWGPLPTFHVNPPKSKSPFGLHSCWHGGATWHRANQQHCGEHLRASEGNSLQRGVQDKGG